MVLTDTARYCDSNIEVDIDELVEEVSNGADPDEIRKTRCFKCLACAECFLVPKALDRQENKVSAHFAQLSDHSDNCDIAGYDALIKSIRKRKSAIKEGFPCGYPSKLVLPVEERKSETFLIDSKNDSSEAFQAGSQYQSPETARRNRTVKTLKLLVKHFLGFTEPEFRELPLYVPGVNVTTYKTVFQRLRWRQSYEYREVRIYFAEILWSKIVLTGDRVYIPTVAGEWISGKPPSQSLFLEIEINRLPRGQFVLRSMIQDCIDMAKGNSPKNNNKREKGWLFFLGSQVEGDRFKFQLYKNDYRLVHCINSNDIDEPPSWISTPIAAGSLQDDEPIQPMMPEQDISVDTQASPDVPDDQLLLPTIDNVPADSVESEAESIEENIDTPSMNELDEVVVENVDSAIYDEPEEESESIPQPKPAKDSQPKPAKDSQPKPNLPDIKETKSISKKHDQIVSNFISCILSGKTPFKKRIRD